MQTQETIFSLPFSPAFRVDSPEGVIERATKLCPRSEATTKAHSPMDAKIRGVINVFDVEAVQTPQQLRNFITNKLVLLAVQAEAESSQLKALEMLGKGKDVAYFEERTTVLIEHLSSAELKAKLSAMAARIAGVMQPAESVEFREL